MGRGMTFARWQQSRGIVPWTVVHATSDLERAVALVPLAFESMGEALNRFARAFSERVNAAFAEIAARLAPQQGG